MRGKAVKKKLGRGEKAAREKDKVEREIEKGGRKERKIS